jgi:hypothetical protein
MLCGCLAAGLHGQALSVPISASVMIQQTGCEGIGQANLACCSLRHTHTFLSNQRSCSLGYCQESVEQRQKRAERRLRASCKCCNGCDGIDVMAGRAHWTFFLLGCEQSGWFDRLLAHTSSVALTSHLVKSCPAPHFWLQSHLCALLNTPTSTAEHHLASERHALSVTASQRSTDTNTNHHLLSEHSLPTQH